MVVIIVFQAIAAFDNVLAEAPEALLLSTTVIEVDGVDLIVAMNETVEKTPDPDVL